jgi:tetratricopeptide (TPR) repeat protein
LVTNELNMRAFKAILLLMCFLPGISLASVDKSANSEITTLIKYSVSSSDTARLNYLIKSGLKHISKKSYSIDQVRAYMDSATAICEKKNIVFPALLFLLRAEYDFETGDFSQSEEEAKLALARAMESKDYIVQVRTYIFLGKYNMTTGFYQESMNSYQKSIQLAKQQGIKGMIASCYYGAANIFIKVGDLNSYRENLRLMIDAAQNENDTLNIQEGLLRLGTSLTDKNPDFRQADSLLRKCIQISMIRKDKYYAGFALTSLGWNFYRKQMYDSSTYCYEKSLKYGISGGYWGIATNALGNLGTINRDLGNPDRAIKYYSKAIDQAKKIQDYYTLSWVFEDMNKMYLMKKDTSNAYNTYVLFKQYYDTLRIKENSEGLNEARIRYEADSHNKEVAFLSLRLKNNRILNVGFAVMVLVAVVIGLLLLRGSKLKTKRRISEMNQKISELTQANLRQQMNPHFIFNTLNSIQYYMYQHDKLATNTYLTKFSSLMRKVLENSHYTAIPVRDELDALTLYLELESLRFKDKFDFEIKVDEEIDTLMYKIPTMLIQPYVENSICHGLVSREGKGTVKINMKLANDHIICTIEDNGIGREAALQIKEMKRSNHNSLGTQIASSRLDLVNSLYGTSLKTIYTDLKNEKGEPEGTRVEIHIPIMT